MPTQKSSGGAVPPDQTSGQGPVLKTPRAGHHARAAFLLPSPTWGLVITAETGRPKVQHRGTGRERISRPSESPWGPWGAGQGEAREA